MYSRPNEMYLSPKPKSRLKWTYAQIEARKKRLELVQDDVNVWVKELKIEKTQSEKNG